MPQHREAQWPVPCTYASFVCAYPLDAGLPEERRILLRALARGYAVVAVSSANRMTRCWNSHQKDKDLVPVAAILAV